jgi:hypothetical protein
MENIPFRNLELSRNGNFRSRLDKMIAFFGALALAGELAERGDVSGVFIP